MNKGFIFGGDSFVWGEGLTLFSNCPVIEEIKKDKVDFNGSEKYSPQAWKFQVENRFPGLVADHYDTFSLVFDRNGGDNYSCLDELIYLIKNTNLNDIGTIIYQPTAIWRSCNLIKHPIITTFGESSEISCYNSKRKYNQLGNGLGFKKHNLHIDNGICGFFEIIDNSLILLLELGIAWESNWNTTKKIKEYITESLPNDGRDYTEVISNIETYYDFILTEYSEFGTTSLEIFENLQLKLVKDCIGFIKNEIYPMFEDYKHIKFYFLETWCSEYTLWKNVSDSFYDNNLISLNPSYDDVKEKFEIARMKDYEWTANPHPSDEGHKWFAKQIIRSLNI